MRPTERSTSPFRFATRPTADRNLRASPNGHSSRDARFLLGLPMSGHLHRVVLTGATGFIGGVLRTRLAASIDAISLGAPDWEARLAKADLEGATILHLAGRAHA